MRMIIVRDREQNYRQIFTARDEYELSYWIKRSNVEINNDRYIIDYINAEDYFQETPETRIQKNRELVIDSLLENEE
tara:strand:+ start:60791 stop:61021 length:231 start_codon:yes stop_codon:yes gene_type:complete